MAITLYTNGHLSIDGKDTGLGVSQTQDGTVVFKREQIGQKYEVVKMPHARYSLAHRTPATNVAGSDQFENDVKHLLGIS